MLPFILEKYVLNKIIDKLPNFFKHLYTLIFVTLGWVIFYFTDLAILMDAFKSLIGLNGLGNINTIIHLQIFKVPTIMIFTFAIVFSTPTDIFKNNNLINYILFIIIFIISIIFIVSSSYNPFIYFRF